MLQAQPSFWPEEFCARDLQAFKDRMVLCKWQFPNPGKVEDTKTVDIAMKAKLEDSLECFS